MLTMQLKFYTLMYVADNERTQFSGKQYAGETKLDMYVKGACVLDKSLRINEGSSLTLLTNSPHAVEDSLNRIGYNELEVLSISFDLDVVPGCAFYSAHYKIDVFRYLGCRPKDEYSVLLDSDVVSIHPLNKDFYSIVDEGIPMVYNLAGYGGKRRLSDVQKIDPDMKWCEWAGGEFVGGTASFFTALYDDICSFKASYWENINNNLFHVGDEMLTSIALNHIRLQYNTVDAGVLGVIYRYWSVYDEVNYEQTGSSLVHFPGDKEFFYRVNLSKTSVKDMMSNYRLYRIKTLFKGFVKKLVIKDWRSRL